MESGSKLPLPDAFLEFLKENSLDPSIYTCTDTIPRYIRLKPGNEKQIEEIEAEISCKLNEVGWLPSFYSLPPYSQIASSKAYQEGKIYGIDAASGAAVLALDISPGDHILDLCAAPGAKLCMLLDFLGDSGSVTGVDIARHRLAACRTMVQKYGIGERCRLFVADGATFSLLPSAGESDVEFTYKEWSSKISWKERKRMAKARQGCSILPAPAITEPELIFYGQHSGVVGHKKDEIFRLASLTESSNYGYDKVLVDAECTHDGSIRHIQKFENWGWETLRHRVLDAERTDDLTMLQFRLLTNGFKLLKDGGFLVYSTCSLTVAQNEDVVQKFLLENPLAEIQEVEDSRGWPCKSGKISKTLRFDPLTSQTSGLFIAKFIKLQDS
ncbi:hypothetical protein V2J09_016482 [Rumex salicifolius]